MSRGISKKHTQVLDLLAKIAEDVEPVNSSRLAAAIVYRNKVIAIGTNSRKSHPLQKKFGKTDDAIFLHAEVCAIKNALKRIDVDMLSKCSIYVARVKRPNPHSKEYVWGIAKPCNGCMGAIESFDIKEVIYTTNEDGVFKNIKRG